MGFFSSLSQLLSLRKREANILVLGLDNSGKSTLLNYLKPPDVQNSTIVPTVGQSESTFRIENLNIHAYDMSGQSKYRNQWETYYSSTHAIIFVIDSTDEIRLAVAKDELWMLIENKDLYSSHRSVPLLICANKNDSTSALSLAQISTGLGVDVLRGPNLEWTIYSTCAISGDGIPKCVDWLTEKIRKQLN